MDDCDLNFEIRPDWETRKSALSAAEKWEISDTCQHEAIGEFKMRAKYNLSHKELDDLLLDDNIERCPTCRLYVESHSRFNPDLDQVDAYCTNCRYPN